MGNKQSSEEPAPLTAAELIQAGWSPGPGLGAELNRLRLQRIDQEER